jgi:hypothetical protein
MKAMAFAKLTRHERSVWCKTRFFAVLRMTMVGRSRNDRFASEKSLEEPGAAP